MEFESQICTTKEQSQRLLELGLKKETADMMYITSVVDGLGKHLPEEYRYYRLKIGEYHKPIGKGMLHIPAWSLHRLLYLIPKEVNIKGYIFPLRSDVILKFGADDYIYEKLIGVIERVIKEGYYNQDYLEEKKMIRARFYSSAYDYRPMKWPIKYPYWCVGETDAAAILVAYADSLDEIYEMWPEAEQVECEEVDEIVFTSRFPKPDWYKEEEK